MRPLSSSRQIRAARAGRHRAASPRMVVSALRRLDGASEVRLAVVAGRPIGTAVARNRAKRRLRAAARQARLSRATDLVVDARPAALTAPFTVLRQDLERLSASAAQRAIIADAGSAEAMDRAAGAQPGASVRWRHSAPLTPPPSKVLHDADAPPSREQPGSPEADRR